MFNDWTHPNSCNNVGLLSPPLPEIGPLCTVYSLQNITILIILNLRGCNCCGGFCPPSNIFKCYLPKDIMSSMQTL